MEKTTRHDRLDFDAYQAQAMTACRGDARGMKKKEVKKK